MDSYGLIPMQVVRLSGIGQDTEALEKKGKKPDPSLEGRLPFLSFFRKLRKIRVIL
jgi:hypothetical protein